MNKHPQENIESISSRQMEDSEIRQKTIHLGKALVRELELEPGVDTLLRWMAHYIAELITKAELVIEEEKEKYEKECFDVIIKLWTHIDNVPNIDTPLRSFSNIENMLEQMTSKSPYRNFPTKYKDETNEYLRLAKDVDFLGKEIIKSAFQNAIVEASEEEKEWLQFDMLDNVQNIQKLLFEFEDGVIIENEDIVQKEKQHFIKKVKEFKAIVDELHL